MPEDLQPAGRGAGPAAVRVEALTRVYPSRKGPTVTALDGVDLIIPRGEVHGLLGPNGAGKTTLVKILATVLLPTSGGAWVLGHDVVAERRAVRAAVGIVFGGERGLYPRLSGRQNVLYWASLYGVHGREARARTERLLAKVGLLERAGQRVETYSRGMKQRLHLARGLVGDPDLLLLDEPTSGMDPVAARGFRALVEELRAEGMTLLLATHDMVEAEALCDRVTLIDRGRLLVTESPHWLRSRIGQNDRVEALGVPGPAIERLAWDPGVEILERRPDGYVLAETASPEVAADVLRELMLAGAESVRTVGPTLEEAYLRLIGARGWEV
jgi:ABC-2 type transport system ATP-binding protein